MPDSDAVRARRWRRHNAGDHSLCRHEGALSVSRVPVGVGWPSYRAEERQQVAQRRFAREERRTLAPGCRTGDHALCDPEDSAHGSCSECGKTVRVGRSSAPPERRRCRDCQRANPKKPQLDPRVCAQCNRTYIPKPMHRPDQRFCSKSCAQTWRNKGRAPVAAADRPADWERTRQLAKSRARRLRRAETWDGITDDEIRERDGWRCQVPGCKRRPIRKDLKYPHPRSKSVDHIVPISLGGDDTAANKRAAHLGCNMARGNQMGEEQVALFGSLREPPLATLTVGERAVMFKPRTPRNSRRCGCGARLPKKRTKCYECQPPRWRRPGPSSRVYYFTCRYCNELKVARSLAREVCEERACQLARLAANNLRARNGLSAEEADAQVRAQVAAAKGPGYGRWRRGAA